MIHEEFSKTGTKVVVIGGSAGGIEVLKQLFASTILVNLSAPIIVVQHTSPHESKLADVLGRVSTVPVAQAHDGVALQNAHIYLAPPDHHVLLDDGHLRVGRGPRVNRHRPAIDPLFRSAAVVGRQRTIGVLLTGLLDDGAAGLAAIQTCGGHTIVQDPEEAAQPSMPAAAMRTHTPNYVLPVEQMSATIHALCNAPLGPAPAIPDILSTEVLLMERAMEGISHADDIRLTAQLGPQVPISCPECGGPLWQIGDECRFRCHVGHAYTIDSLLSQEDSNLERALWAAVRSLESTANTLKAMAEREKKFNHTMISERYEERGEESLSHAAKIREILMNFRRAEP